MSDAKNRDNLLSLIEAQSPLQGRFESLTRLGPDGGTGAFSLVFTAYDNLAKEKVIVKAFQPFCRDPYRTEAFKRESEMLQRLECCDGIIKIVAPCTEFSIVLEPYGLTLDVPYYVLEQAETDLAELIAAGVIETEWLLVAFREMCRATQLIHKKKIAHRDLKPRNLLVTRDGRLRLSDFGSARMLTDEAKPILEDYAGYPPGDIPYAAPEIICSLHDVDPEVAYKADVFSLGAVLFEMLTGVMLGPQIYDLQYQLDLVDYMAAVPRDQRRRAFDEFISELADKRPLPDVRAFRPVVEKCVLPIVGELYGRIAALDYRKRVGNFEYMFLKIDQALLVLRNQEKFKHWQEKRERYRRDLELKRERIAARFGRVVGGKQ